MTERQSLLFALVILASAVTSFEITMPGVQPQNEDAYLCVAKQLKKDHNIMAFEKFNVSKHAHHMIIFKCRSPTILSHAWDCMHASMCNEGEATIIFSWAMEAPNFALPEGNAFHFSAGDYLGVQIHYKNTADFKKDPSLRDYSGFKMIETKQEPKRIVDILVMITTGVLPPHMKTDLRGSCQKTSKVPIHPIAFRVHAHRLSDKIEAWAERDGRKWLLGVDSPKHAQTFNPVNNTSPLLPGDRYEFACHYDNVEDKTVVTGSTQKDEMCNFYLMYGIDYKQEKSLDSNDFECYSFGSEVEPQFEDFDLFSSKPSDEYYNFEQE